MLTKPAPILVADRFPALLGDLLGLLESLSPGELEAPTAAPDWSVKDVALHLLGDEVGILAWQRDHFSTAPASITNWHGLVEWVNQRNAEWVNAVRRMSPRVLCDLLRYTGLQACAFFDSVDPYALGGEVSWAAQGPAPNWMGIAREFTERWHHQQHIRDAVRRPGAAGAEYLAPVLETFVRALPRTYQAVDAVLGTSVTLEISGPSGGAWSVVKGAAGWELFTGRPDLPEALVHINEEIAWRLFTRGISAEQARVYADLTGDPRLAEGLLETVAIIA